MKSQFCGLSSWFVSHYRVNYAPNLLSSREISCGFLQDESIVDHWNVMQSGLLVCCWCPLIKGEILFVFPSWWMRFLWPFLTSHCSTNNYHQGCGKIILLNFVLINSEIFVWLKTWWPFLCCFAVFTVIWFSDARLKLPFRCYYLIWRKNFLYNKQLLGKNCNSKAKVATFKIAILRHKLPFWVKAALFFIVAVAILRQNFIF